MAVFAYVRLKLVVLGKNHVGGRDGSVVSASDLGPEGREFEPW